MSQVITNQNKFHKLNPLKKAKGENKMIIVREIFRLKFGKAKEAKDLFKEMKKIAAGMDVDLGKVMTDLTGPSYTLVMETEFDSLSDFETKIKTAFSNADWQKWYQKFIPLVDSASREIYTLVD